MIFELVWDVSMKVSEFVRQERAARGLSRRQLAELIGCAETFVGKLERGEQKEIGLSTLLKLCDAFNMRLVLRKYEEVGQ